MNDPIASRLTEKPYLVERSSGYFEYQLPVSVKAVIFWRGRVPLLMNERNEWELPGGKLELGESPHNCVMREIKEELSIEAHVEERPIDTWVYEIFPDRHVLIITFCGMSDSVEAPQFSHEHKSLRMVEPDEVEGLTMPLNYKKSIVSAARLMGLRS